MKGRLRLHLPVALIVALLALWPAGQGEAAETAAERDARMRWWREARFGMFIHWGIYSVLGRGEWVMHNERIPLEQYEGLASRFDPADFDAREWVQLARDAGQSYIVITAKHHDGFCMFDSALTDYDIMSTPFGRDVLKELAEECHRQGIRIGWYYSIMDWHHPDYLPRRDWDERPPDGADYGRHIDYVKGQLRELLTDYGEIAVIWFDGGWEHPAEEHRAEEVMAMIRELQPRVIVNNRLGLRGDYETPEQEIPEAARPGRDWETCMTINYHWGYAANDDHHKSVEELLFDLVDVASKGGNFLLNVGPRPDGTIQAEHRERLRAVGAWLARNGESVYGTTAGPFRRLPWGRCTAKPGRLYLHVLHWPGSGQLEVPGLNNEVTHAYLLSDDARTPLAADRYEDGVLVAVPPRAPDEPDSVVVLEIEGEPDVTPMPLMQARDGTVTLRAADATVHGESARYERGAGKDNIGFWTDPEDWVEWRFRPKAPGMFRVEVTYACAPGAEGAGYAVVVGDGWVTGRTEATGSWSEFRTDELGAVGLPAGGDYALSVKPLLMPGYAVMNLRAVRLIPVE
jgi:alpha-L-fucosidase